MSVYEGAEKRAGYSGGAGDSVRFRDFGNDGGVLGTPAFKEHRGRDDSISSVQHRCLSYCYICFDRYIYETGPGHDQKGMDARMQSRYFEDRYGRTAAVLIPGIVFALLHIMNRQEPAEMFLTVLYTFVLALLFGLIRSRTGSFWPCAAAHGIWNFIYTGCISMGTAGENSPIMYYEIASGNYLIIPIIIIALFCAGYATVCRNRQKK